VAVKVIEHNTDTTVPVEREVTLMLSFNHPNIVRAFHFVTRVHSSEVGELTGFGYGQSVRTLRSRATSAIYRMLDVERSWASRTMQAMC